MGTEVLGPKTRVVAAFHPILGIDLYRVDYWSASYHEQSWKELTLVKDQDEAEVIAKRVMQFGLSGLERVLVEFSP